LLIYIFACKTQCETIVERTADKKTTFQFRKFVTAVLTKLQYAKEVDLWSIS